MSRHIRSILAAMLIVAGVTAGLPLEPWWRIATVAVLVYAGARLLS